MLETKYKLTGEIRVPTGRDIVWSHGHQQFLEWDHASTYSKYPIAVPIDTPEPSGWVDGAPTEDGLYAVKVNVGYEVLQWSNGGWYWSGTMREYSLPVHKHHLPRLPATALAPLPELPKLFRARFANEPVTGVYLEGFCLPFRFVYGKELRSCNEAGLTDIRYIEVKE